MLYAPHVGERKYRIHESERRRRSTRHDLIFAASRDASIQTLTKKGKGESFPVRQAWEFGIVCSRQGGRKVNKQIKVERLSFGKIWFYGVRTHYGGSTTYYSLLSGFGAAIHTTPCRRLVHDITYQAVHAYNPPHISGWTAHRPKVEHTSIIYVALSFRFIGLI